MHNPMHQARAVLESLPRCGAKCRSGQSCQNVPMHRKQRCRMHGGKSPGAPLKHGQRSKAAVEQRRADWLLLKSLSNLVEVAGSGTTRRQDRR